MKSSFRARKGLVLVTALVVVAVAALVFGGVIGYVSTMTRLTALHLGNTTCRLAAQSEIELAKAAINDAFSRSIARGAHIVGGVVGSTICSFDWFGLGEQTEVVRTIGAENGLGSSVTFDEAVTNNGCTVRVRVSKIVHPAQTQWAEVTLRAEAVLERPGLPSSRQVIEETVRFAQQRSKVFNNAYFVNNYGWFQGSGCTANGDVRANGDIYLDSSCKINGKVYAARNEELRVNGDVTNYGTMDPLSTYRSSSYGTSNRARPLANDPVSGAPVAGGYDAPASATTAAKKGRIHANEERETEMPFIGDLTSPQSDYRQWVKELRQANPTMCTLKQGGKTLVTEYYDGAGPSGDPSLADAGVLVLEGTQTKPIELNGPVIVKSDVIIKGYVKGQGTIYSGRNIHIVGNIQYVNPPTWSGKQANANNAKKDMLGLMAKGNIVMGDCTDPTWLSSIKTYLTSQPYVQKYKCDSTDDLIGYPATFGGSYAATEYVGAFAAGENAASAPGGYDTASGRFGKVREVTEKVGSHQETTYDRWGRKTTKTVDDYQTVLKTVYDRKYYESVCLDREISSRCSTITQIDAILYNNHGIFGKLGKCTINGALVCRNEGLQYSSNLYLNWDIRLYSASSETVDNAQVGLAKASDSPPVTVAWRLLPSESVSASGRE